jgi:5'-deoxynucleotidase YfbR-like HD superfamily hydrolase
MKSAQQGRIGNWIQTFSGKCFWPFDPRPEEVRIVDIAHSLSMRCRYGGHCTKFYSVAEHSILVSNHVKSEHALWGLLHDAAEAYSFDVLGPLKKDLPECRALEARIMVAVCRRFGLLEEEPENVSFIDRSIIADEKAILMVQCERDWDTHPPRIGAHILALSPMAAKAIFLERFAELYHE